MNSQTFVDSTNLCLEAFQKLLSSPVLGDETMQKPLARFNYWAANIGVFAPPRASLDVRLKNSTNYRRLLFQLLDVLERNLLAATNPPAQNADMDTNATFHQDVIQVVNDIISSLHRLSATIRRSAAQDRNLKAANFVERDDEGEDVNGVFQENVTRIIQQRYPDANKAVCKRLGESTSIRRRRVLYSRRHQVRLAVGSHFPASAQRIVPIVVPDPVPETLPVTPDYTSIPQPFPQPAPVATSMRPSETAASIPESDTIAPSLASSASTSSTIQDQNLRYPPVPHLNAQTGDASCPYCTAVLTKDDVLNKKQWRRHLKRDIEPFVCTVASCSGQVQLFHNFKLWLKHIKQEHRLQWHCSMATHRPIVFSDREKFEFHMSTEHQGKLNQSQLTALVRRGARPASHAFDECPLCKARLEDVNGGEHFAEDVVISDRLPRHVAGHLKTLAFMFLPPSNDLDEDGTDEIGSSSTKKSSRSVDRDSVFELSLTFDDDAPSREDHDDNEWSFILRENYDRDQDATLTEFASRQLAQSHTTMKCALLPRRNRRFFRRTDILELITAHFRPDRTSSFKPMSMALYGLAGVGKSAIALEYAYRRLEDYDAIFWVCSENHLSMAQSFTDIAVKWRLDKAHENPRDHAANRFIVQKWLQHTSLRWLMIFDNVENQDLLLDYWPPGQGHSLITTRNRMLALEPAGSGLEVHTFPNQEGAIFLMNLLPSRDSTSDDDSTAATQLSSALGGHPLAICDMASFIHRRAYSISEFLKIYETHADKIHQRGDLASLWRLSFESLSGSASNLLAILCLLSPDAMPEELFELNDSMHVPQSLDFAQDGFEFAEALESLLVLSLVRRDNETKSISMHRLVQTQYRRFQREAEYQEAFNNATALLCLAFPSKKTNSDQMYGVWDQCQKYVANVLRLLSNYKEHPLQPTADFYNLLTSCAHYLCEIGSYDELENVLEIGRQAYDTLGTKRKVEKDTDHFILADLERYSGLLAFRTGKFSVAHKHISYSLEIYKMRLPQDSPIVSYLYHDLSNVVASQGKSDLALEFAERAYRSKSDQLESLISRDLSKAQISALVGRTSEARILYHRAIEKSPGEGKWATLAFAYFGLGKLDQEEGDFDSALKYYELARETFILHAAMHEFVAACCYHLGGIFLDKLDQGDIAASIDWLHQSLKILQMKKPYLLADYARTSFKLAQAYERGGEQEKLALFKQAATEALRSALEADISDINVDYNAQRSYDSAICVLWR